MCGVWLCWFVGGVVGGVSGCWGCGGLRVGCGWGWGVGGVFVWWGFGVWGVEVWGVEVWGVKVWGVEVWGVDVLKLPAVQMWQEECGAQAMPLTQARWLLRRATGVQGTRTSRITTCDTPPANTRKLSSTHPP